jgi:iron complex transport system ATP-binding protein
MSLCAKNISLSYGATPILADINLVLSKGELVALIGPNGSGKTTLLHALSGLLQPSQGVIYLDKQDLLEMVPSEIARRLTTLEQEIHAAFEISVREVVSLGRLTHQSRWTSLTPEDREIIERVMREMGVSEFADRSVQTLSSGERQRVWLAMALAQEPQILLLDEPTSHLDLKYQIEIMSILKQLTRTGLSVLVSLHDLNLAMRFSDRVALVANRQLLALGEPEEVLTRKLIEKAYGLPVELIQTAGGAFLVAPQIDVPSLVDPAVKRG